MAVQEGPIDGKEIVSFEEGGYAVADGCENWLEMSGEDEDHTCQLDGISDQNTNHNYETVLQLAFPRNICSLSQTVINGPLCRGEENVWVFRICIDWAEGPGRGIGGKVFVVAFVVVVNQIIWIADPIVTCVVGDIVLDRNCSRIVVFGYGRVTVSFVTTRRLAQPFILPFPEP